MEAQIRDDPSPYHHKTHHPRHESNHTHRSFIRDADVASHGPHATATRQKRGRQTSPRRQQLPELRSQKDAKFSPSKLALVAQASRGNYGGQSSGHVAAELPFALRGTRSISPMNETASLGDSVTYTTPTLDPYPHHTAFSPTKQQLAAGIHRGPTASHLHVSPAHYGRDHLLNSLDDGQTADGVDLPPAASMLQQFSLARRAPPMEHHFPSPHHHQQRSGGRLIATHASNVSRLAENPGYDPVSNMFGTTAGYR